MEQIHQKVNDWYYLRLLLNHIKGPNSSQDLLSYNGVQYLSFKEATQKGGLLESDDSISKCLREATYFQMHLAMHHLFATTLVHCQPTDVRNLWDTHFDSMLEDFLTIHQFPHETQISSTLKSVNFFLQSMGKNGIDYDLHSWISVTQMQIPLRIERSLMSWL